MPGGLATRQRDRLDCPPGRLPPVSAFLLGGYASVKAIVQPRQAGASSHQRDKCLGAVVNGSHRGWHLRCAWRPVLAASGRNWASREAA